MSVRKTALRALAIVAVATGVALYWRSSFGIYFFADDWDVLSTYAALDGPGILRDYFRPHNQHFMPLFKAVYYLQYCLFGLDIMGYHIVNMAFFAFGSMLLYYFVLGETGDRAAACFLAVLYAINSISHNIVSWVFLEQMTLAFVFMLAALIAASKEMARERPLYLAASFCLLSSVSFGIGITSAVVVSVFYLLKARYVYGRSLVDKKSVLDLAPLAALALIYAAAYAWFGREVRGIGEGASALFVVKSTALTIGDMLVKTAGVFIEYWTSLDRDSAALQAINAGASLVYVVLLALLIRRLKRTIKHLAMLGVFAMVFFTAFIMFTRAAAEVYLPGIDRYKYFPFMGLAFSLAPALAHLREKAKWAGAALLVMLVPLTALHHWKVERSFYSDDTAKLFVAMTEKDLASGGTRFIEDMGSIKVGHINNISYLNFLHLVKQPDDKVVRFKGGLLLLKEHENLRPTRWALPENAAMSGNRIAVKGAAGKSALTLKGADTGRFGHLYMRLKSGTPFEGSIIRRGEDGQTRRTSFEVAAGRTFKEYLLACPDGRDIVIIVGPGEVAIEDVRIYR